MAHLTLACRIEPEALSRALPALGARVGGFRKGMSRSADYRMPLCKPESNWLQKRKGSLEETSKEGPVPLSAVLAVIQVSYREHQSPNQGSSSAAPAATTTSTTLIK
eukprot:3036183-Amphidinium_carterae.1